MTIIVYIYAIQNKKNDDNSFCKKINRIIYRVGEGFSQDSDVGGENLRDITASFLVSLNICFSFFHNLGFNKLSVPSILIARWNAKKIANFLKIKIKNMIDKEAVSLDINQDILQHNITNKLIRTFLRLGCHYNNIDILSFPYEVDSCLNISINDNIVQCNNALLYDTYKLVENGVNKSSYLR